MDSINKNSKYLIIVQERDGHFGEEQWPGFPITQDTDGSPLPPAGAVHYDDFIATDFGGGSNDVGGDTADPYTDGNINSSIPQTGTLSSSPQYDILCGFKDLMFLLYGGSSYIDISGNSSGAKLSDAEVFEVIQKISTVRSESVYLGKYTDEEVKRLGTQVSQLELEFSDSGIVVASTDTQNSKDSLDFLKNDFFNAYWVNKPLANWNLSGIFMKAVTKPSEANFDIDNFNNLDPVTGAGFQQIGCTISSAKITIDFNLDDSSSQNFCLKNTATGTGSTHSYRGQVPVGTPKYTVEFTNGQTVSDWMQRYYGGIGAVEFMKQNPFHIGLYLTNDDNEIMRIAIPSATLTLSSPDLKRDKPEETITFTATTGNIKTRNIIDTADVISSGPIGIRYGQGGGVNVSGIGYATLGWTGDFESSAFKDTILEIRQNTGTLSVPVAGELQGLHTYNGSQDNNLMLPLFYGDYILRKRTSVNTSGAIQGLFSVAKVDDINNPVNLTGCYTRAPASTPCPATGDAALSYDERVNKQADDEKNDILKAFGHPVDEDDDE